MPICKSRMLICMRTTILLPDELYDAVRQHASQQRRTITSVIEEAVRASLRAHAAAAHQPALSIDVIQGRGLQPGVDLDDTSALADLMDRA